MKKLASVLGVLALFGACNSESADDNDTSTGGTAGSTSNGGAGGSSGAAEGGASTGFGGKTSAKGGAANGGGAGDVSQLGGAGGIESGGAGGSAEAGGGAGAGAGGATDLPPIDVPSTDTCAEAEAVPNDDRTTATAYTLGTNYTACLQNPDDVDFYSFQIPADSRGGYVTVSVTHVGPTGDISLEAYTQADSGRFFKTGSNTDGGEVYAYFTVKPGAKLDLSITKYLDNPTPNPYTLLATYHQVPDVYEPNDVRADAKAITVGTPVEAYLTAGREYSTAIPEGEWEDWYKVELAAGTVDIVLAPNARDVDGKIVLYSSVGTQLVTKGDNTEGSSVELTHEIATAGTYYLKISPYEAARTEGNTATVPYYLKQPYTLTVTQ